MANYFMQRITGGSNALEKSHELLNNGFLSIGWKDFSTKEFAKDVRAGGMQVIENKYKSEGWNLKRNRWSLWRFICQMHSDDYVLVPGFPNYSKVSIYKIVSNEIYTNDCDEIKNIKIDSKVDLGFYRKVEIVSDKISRSTLSDNLYRRLKIQQTNSCINDLHKDIDDVLNGETQIESKETTFDITTAVYCIKNSRDNGKKTLLEENLTYRIPIYQRPYSWSDKEVERLLNDIFYGYYGGVEDEENSNVSSEPMFIGNMQLTNRFENDEQEQYVDVVDGQQRISTLFVLLKYLSVKYKDELHIDFEWLETGVADENLKLEELKNIEESVDRKYNDNRYLKNYDYISRYFDSKLNNVKNFDVKSFVDYIFNSIYFVVVETQASLSQIVKIFNSINTAGLPLNPENLFKLQMSEYLQLQSNGSLSQDDAFKRVDVLYKKVSEKNNYYKKEYSILTILRQYQYYIVAKYKLPIILYKFSVEKFYDNLFETLLGVRVWEHFTKVNDANNKMEIIKYEQIEWMIDVVYKWDELCKNETDKEKIFNRRIIYWTRYSQYANIAYLILFQINEEGTKEYIDNLLSLLSKLFIIYSLEYAKAINGMHSLMYSIREYIVNNEFSKATTEVQNKINEYSADKLINNLGAEIAIMSTAVNKNLICRLSEFLLIKTDKEMNSENMIKLLFETRADVEHIHANANSEECVGINSLLQNSIGNLMLLEYDINRSIQAIPFEEKKKRYKESKFKTTKVISKENSWGSEQIKKRKEEQVKLIKEFLMPEKKENSEPNTLQI